MSARLEPFEERAQLHVMLQVLGARPRRVEGARVLPEVDLRQLVDRLAQLLIELVPAKAKEEYTTRRARLAGKRPRRASSVVWYYGAWRRTS